jgi:hypothetical protein
MEVACCRQNWIGHFSLILPSLIEASHIAGRGAPLEMTGETKSGAQRARLYGLGASGLQGPRSAPYSTLLYILLSGLLRLF